MEKNGKDYEWNGFLLKSNALIYESCNNMYPYITDGLQNDFKSPCIVFAGHPSLRMGDVVHFIELWGRSASNTILFTGKCSI